MSQCSTALEPGVQLQSGLAECRVMHLTGSFEASRGLPAAGLLGGISPPHILRPLPAAMQRLPADLPLPQVLNASPYISCHSFYPEAKDGQSGCAAPKDAGSHVATPLCVPLQELLTTCRVSDEAGEAVISRCDAATRGIAARCRLVSGH